MSDSDLDNLSDELELRLGTDPFRADTDGHGVGDFAERRLGTDPTAFDTTATASATGRSSPGGATRCTGMPRTRWA